MKLAARTAGLASALAICTAAAPGALAQAPGTDPDRCPGVEGTIFGCPDSDGDRIPDMDDECPTVADPNAPDYFFDGCPDAVFGVRYRVRVVPGGLGVSFRVAYIAGFKGVGIARSECRLRSGRSCGGRTVYRPGTRWVIWVTRGPGSQIIECHRMTLKSTGASVRSFRGPEETARFGPNCRELF